MQLLSVAVGVYTVSKYKIEKDVEIIGAGVDQTFVQANPAYNTGSGWVFLTDADVKMKNITVRYGVDGAGSGIMNFQELELDNCRICYHWSNNDGGAINNRYTGILTIRNSIFDHNYCIYAGSAIKNDGGEVYIENSTFHDNHADSPWDGGTICNFAGGTDDAYISMINTTIYGNTANAKGGGIYSRNDGSGLVKTDLYNCTITHNQSVEGGGIARTGGEVHLYNTIVAENTASLGPDIIGQVVSHGHNLVGIIDGSTGLTVGNPNPQSDYIGTSTSPIVPQLASLTDNGGPTQTCALLTGSLCIDAGNDTYAPTTDQRGFGRNGTSDIGAYEYNGVNPNQTAPPPNRPRPLAECCRC